MKLNNSVKYSAAVLIIVSFVCATILSCDFAESNSNDKVFASGSGTYTEAHSDDSPEDIHYGDTPCSGGHCHSSGHSHVVSLTTLSSMFLNSNVVYTYLSSEIFHESPYLSNLFRPPTA